MAFQRTQLEDLLIYSICQQYHICPAVDMLRKSSVLLLGYAGLTYIVMLVAEENESRE